MTRQRRKDRRARTNLSLMKRRLSVDEETMARYKKEGKHLCIVNDDPGKIQAYLDNGYEYVTVKRAPVLTGDDEAFNEQDVKVMFKVGKNEDGSQKTAFLMALPNEYKAEDAAEKEAYSKKIDASIRSGETRGVSPHGVPKSQGSAYVKNVDYKP